MTSRLKLRFVLLSILLGIMLIVLYLQHSFIPSHMQKLLSKKLAESYPHSIKYDHLRYNPFQGILLNNIEIKSDDGKTFFKAKKVVLGLQLLKYFTDEKIILSQLILDEPVFKTKRPLEADEGMLAFVLPLIAALPSTNLGFTLPEETDLYAIDIRRGTLLWARGPNEADIEKIHRLNLVVDLSNKEELTFHGGFRVGESEFMKLSFNGKWDLDKKVPQISAKGHLTSLPEWIGSSDNEYGNLSLTECDSSFETQIFPNESDTLSYSIQTRDSLVGFELNQYSIRGKASFYMIGLYNFKDRQIVSPKGSVRILDAELDGLPAPVNKFEKITGKIFFEPGKIHLHRLVSATENIKTVLSGSLDLTKHRFFDINLRQKTNCLHLLNTLLDPSQQKLFSEDVLSGDFDITARVIGDLENLAGVRKNITIKIDDANWSIPDSDIEFLKISGTQIFTDDQIIFENISFEHEDIPMVLNGKLLLGMGEESNISLKNPKFRAYLKLISDEDKIHIPSLKIVSGLSEANLEGSIDNFRPFEVDLTGAILADFEDITANFSKTLPLLDDLKPSGAAEISLQVEGPLLDATKRRIFLRSEIPIITLRDKFQLTHAGVDLEYSDRNLALSYLRTYMYGGEIRATGAMNFKEIKNPSFNLSLSHLGMDLSQTVPHFDFLEKEFSGTMHLNFDVEGIWGKPKSITGDGEFEIEDGHLFTTQMYKKLRNVFFVTIEGIDNMTFKTAEGDFYIWGAALHTDNTLFTSPFIELTARGDIAFNQHIHFNLSSRFTPYLIHESRHLGGFAPYLIDYAEQSISQYQVTGTLTNPSYQEL